MIHAEDVGAALSELRGVRELRDVAEEAGISSSLLRDYEDGRKMPDSPALDRLTEALDVSGPELEYRISSAWRDRLDASHPELRTVRRQEILEHVQAIGEHLTALVSKLEDSSSS